MIASAVDPPAEGDGLAFVGDPEFAAGVGSEHGESIGFEEEVW